MRDKRMKAEETERMELRKLEDRCSTVDFVL